MKHQLLYTSQQLRYGSDCLCDVFWVEGVYIKCVPEALIEQIADNPKKAWALQVG